MRYVLQTESLTRTYGSRRGIDDVNLAIAEGALYGFLGPNGAGKTTTIRCLLGFLRASSGSARIFGLDCWKHSRAIKADVGSIPGDLRLYPWLTGHAALRLFGLIRRRDIRALGTQLADEFELDLRVKVRQMSRGMRQKLGLILALAHEPKLIILDEPSSALDPLMQDRLRAMLKRMAARGQTVFFSSHTLNEVEALCERVAIVRAGRIVADSTLDDLRRQAKHEFEITWADNMGDRTTPPDFADIKAKSASKWTGSVDDGSLRPMLDFLAGKPIDDIRIARPDLETLFRRYYETDTPPPSSNGPTANAANLNGTASNVTSQRNNKEAAR
jgi:ABC-2 type transport system ATP-binding protein